MGACNTEAYAGVELERHNASVGAAVYELFGGRLGALGRRGVARHLAGALPRLGPGALLSIAVLAGSLHDVGKASPAYRRAPEGGRASYYGHEAVGAVLLHRAASSLLMRGRRGEALVLELAAWAVARHHSAMRDRHPVDAEDRFRRRALAALRELACEPGCLEAGLPGPLKGSWVARALAEAAEGLAGPRGPGASRLGAILDKELRALSGYPAWLEGLVPRGAWLAYVYAASGAVVVADVLVAGWEGRETDEGVEPSYAAWWRAELERRAVESVRRLARDRGAAERLLGEALGPLLSLPGPS